MKLVFAALVAVLLGTVSASCSFSTAHLGKSQVIVSAPRSALPSLGRSLGSLPSSFADRKLALDSLRPIPGTTARGLSSSRSISASNDIASMSFRVENVDPGSGENVLADAMDPSYPYLELWLTPGETYKISVEVVPVAGGPGSLVGVTLFGDQCEVTVNDDGTPTYADLYVHPIETPVFFQRTNSLAPNVPQTGGSPVSTPIFGTALNNSPRDKFFYSPSGELYYFNQLANSVYRWDDLSALCSTTPVFNDAGVTLDAVCHDPLYDRTLWAVGHDGSGFVHIYLIDVDNPSTSNASDPINADLGVSVIAGSDTIVPTAIAVDPRGGVYISFYRRATSTDPVLSGVVAYVDGFIVPWVPDTINNTWNSTNSLYMDLSFEQGRLLALRCPIYGSPGWAGLAPNNTGTADLQVFDRTLNPLSPSPTTVGRVYSSGSPPFLMDSALSLPVKFAAPAHGDWIFVNENNPVQQGAGLPSEKVKAIRTDGSQHVNLWVMPS